MTIGGPQFLRRSLSLAVVGILLTLVAACTGRGGGQLPPDKVLFRGQASFGFSFLCEDQGGINPPTGQLRIQLSYTDHGPNPIGSQFSIHGIVDQINPVLESAVCIGQNPPPRPENQLIFLGRYFVTSSAPSGFPSTCPSRETATTPLCRFEVIVRDNDRNQAPSAGDYFHIALSSATALDCSRPAECSQLPKTAVFYTRGGTLSAGNITVN